MGGIVVVQEIPHDGQRLRGEQNYYEALMQDTYDGNQELNDTNNSSSAYSQSPPNCSTLNYQIGSARFATADFAAGKTLRATKSVVDSGATRHMFPNRAFFLQYKATPGHYVLLADDTKTPCLGVGTAKFCIGGKTILLPDFLRSFDLIERLIRRGRIFGERSLREFFLGDCRRLG